jgi:hypothetical protein
MAFKSIRLPFGKPLIEAITSIAYDGLSIKLASLPGVTAASQNRLFLLCLLLSEEEALDLATGRFGQRADELDKAG